MFAGGNVDERHSEQLMPYLNSSEKVAGTDMEMVVNIEKELKRKIVYFKRDTEIQLCLLLFFLHCIGI